MYLTTWGFSALRRRAAGLLAAIVTVAVAVGVTPTRAAHAADPTQDFQNKYVMAGVYLSSLNPERDMVASLEPGGQSWRVQNRGTLNNHPLVRLQQYYYRSDEFGYRCLDGNNAGANGRAMVKLCGTNTNQVWEVFKNANGTVTFKNYGDWTKRRVHLCLSADYGHVVEMRTCNAASAWQQWV